MPVPHVSPWLSLGAHGLREEPEFVTARAGEGVVLRCDVIHPVTGQPPPYVVEWFKFGVPIPIFIKFGYYPPHVDPEYAGNRRAMTAVPLSLHLPFRAQRRPPRPGYSSFLSVTSDLSLDWAYYLSSSWSLPFPFPLCPLVGFRHESERKSKRQARSLCLHPADVPGLQGKREQGPPWRKQGADVGRESDTSTSPRCGTARLAGSAVCVPPLFWL